MSKSNMPGFTAEASLHTTTEHYWAVAGFSATGAHDVIPQGIFGDIADWLYDTLAKPVNRRLACTGAAAAGSAICGPAAGKCFDAIYDKCMS